MFHRVGNILRDPSRTTVKSWAARHLLTSLINCGTCGQKMKPLKTHGEDTYRCRHKFCTSIAAKPIEEYVERLIVGYLARPDVAAFLEAAAVSDRAQAAERAELERLRGSLESWRQLSASGEADPVTATRSINGLRAAIEKAEAKLKRDSYPPALRGRVGPHAEASWADSTLAEKRAIIRTCLHVRVAPTGAGRRWRSVSEQIETTWIIGPDQKALNKQPMPHAPTPGAVLRSWFEEHGEARSIRDAQDYIREQEIKRNPKIVERDLRTLADAGVLIRIKRGLKLYYQISPDQAGPSRP